MSDAIVVRVEGSRRNSGNLRWYRIKVTMRWEDGEDSYLGIPARVVQYEAPEVRADNLCRVWMIDDIGNRFSTPLFWIRYARQDVFLSIMISFYLSFGRYEGKSSAVILKFELMHTPISETGSDLQSSLGSYSASVYEYRIHPKALLGLHSYCPVHFDAFHAVLVDTSVHISLIRAGYSRPRLKVPGLSEFMFYGSNQTHDILLEDLRRISKGINQAIDLTGINIKPDITKSLHSTSPAHVKSIDGEASLQLSDSPQVSAEVLNSSNVNASLSVLFS